MDTFGIQWSIKRICLMKHLAITLCLLGSCIFASAQKINTLGKGLRSQGSPYNIVEDASGRVYVGGNIKEIDGIETISMAILENGVWSQLPGDPEVAWKTQTVGNDLYVSGLFATSNGGVLHWDGLQWDTLSDGLPNGMTVQDMDWAENYLWMLLGDQSLVRWENDTWKTAPSPAGLRLIGMKSLGDTLFSWGYLVSGNVGYAAISYFNSGAWTQLPPLSEYNSISDVERWGQKIYIALGNKILQWNGNSWDEFYSVNASQSIKYIVGIQNDLFVCSQKSSSYRIEKLDADANATLIGTIENPSNSNWVAKAIKGKLWIGGGFSHIDDEYLGGLAWYNGSNWESPGQPVGTFLSSTYGFCLYRDTLSGDLYVGGEFDFAGSGFASNIARWDGAQWHPMGAGFNSRVREIFRYQGQLYAAGSFTKSGAQDCPYLARWSGTEWEPVLPALDNIVRDAIEWNGKLYLAGEFSQPAPGLMAFDGATWTGLDNSGSAGYSLAIFENKLIAGKYNNIIELDASGVVSVIGNFATVVLDLTVHNGELYAAVNQISDKGIYKYAGNGQWTNLNLPLELYETPWRIFSVSGNLLVMVDNKGMFRYNNGEWQFLESWRITDMEPAGPDRYFVSSFPAYLNQNGQSYKTINGVGEMVVEKPEVSVMRTGDDAICPRKHVFWSPATDDIFVRYHWSFPGANISTSGELFPVNQYPQSGSYPAVLIAENLGGADTIEIPTVVVDDDCIVPPGPKPDNVWLLGSYFFADGLTPALDFYYNRPDSAGIYTHVDIGSTNASICDDDGNLLFYTNGIDLVNSHHESIEGSQDFNKDGLYTVYDYITYSFDNQGALILPYPEHPGQYYVFHMASSEFSISMDTGSRSFLQPLRLAYSIVDMNANNGHGQMTVKSITAVSDTLMQGTLNAVRHGNGRDWWIVAHEFNNKGFHILLLTPNGITNSTLQPAGLLVPPCGTGGQAAFSPDGSWYGLTDDLSDTAYIWRFDRCVGAFQAETILSYGPAEPWTGIGTGCSFSPSGQFFYASNNRFLYQFDLLADDIPNSKQLAGKWDGQGTPYSGNYLSKHLNAPDGKIYLSFYDGYNQYLNAIQYPDEPGAGCQYLNRAAALPARSKAVLPNYPNLRLGEIPGLSCNERASTLSETNWKIFPNPASGAFTLRPETPLNSGDSYLVALYNLTGQLVFSENRSFNWEQYFDITGLSPGTYVLQISGQNEHKALKLVITP